MTTGTARRLARQAEMPRLRSRSSHRRCAVRVRAGSAIASLTDTVLHSLRRSNQSLSASPLSHAETPWGLAFRLYPAFSCGVQRKRTTAVAGFLMGGLPLGLGLSMPRLCGYTKFLTSPLPSYLM